MELKKEKALRFYDDGKQKVLALSKVQPEPFFKAPESIKFLVYGEKNNKINHKIPRFGRFKFFHEIREPWRKRILNPGSYIYLQWNRVFLFSCLVALFVDPLFFYLPSVATDGSSSCMQTDMNLGIVVTCLRTFADMFYLMNMVIKFRTAYVSPSPRVFGRGELVMDAKEIAKRCLRSDSS